MTIPPYIKAPILVIDGIPLTRAVVNGKMRTFIIDSGAPSLIINANFSEQDATGATTEFEGVGGKGKQGLMDVKLFKWHDFEVKNFTAPVIDLSHLEAELKTSFYGLIGYKELANFSFCLDYSKNEILLWQELDVKEFNVKAEIPFTMNKHIPLINISMGKENLLVGLDSGAAINLLDINKQGKNVKFLEEDTLIGADKSVQQIQKGISEEVKINGLSFKDMQVVWSDIDHLIAAFGELDGLFGYEFLKQEKMIVSFEHSKIFILK